MATIREVARLAGVSVATVSKYLNGTKVRDANARAVEEAVRALDYKPNEIARGLRKSSSMTVGVLLPELDNLFFTQIISSVDAVLEERGYSTLVCVSRSDPEREQRRLDFLRRKQIDGLIAVPTTAASDFVTLAGDLPTVFVDRVVSAAVTSGVRCSSVLSDNFAAAYGAAEELILAGHTRIGVLLGPDSNYTPLERRAGFLAACALHGIGEGDLFLSAGAYTVEAGYRMTKELLALEDRPTALFATNNELTIGAVGALAEAGITPGEEISFIGFDNRTLAEISHPKLTVIVQPVAEIGRRAAETLLGLIDGEAGGGILHLPTETIRGESVRRITS